MMFSLNEIVSVTNRLIKEDATGLEDIIKTLLAAVRSSVMNGVSGGIAEFGTMTGRTALALAIGCGYYFSHYRKNDIRHGYTEDRFLHLFDSFEGLPQAGNNYDLLNLHVKTGIWASGTCKGLSADQLRSLIAQIGAQKFTFVFEGWFKDTLVQIPSESRYSVIHVDCDLYESTVDALVPLFQRKQISKGAQILFDDFNCSQANKELGERRAWSDLCARFQIDCELMGYYAVSGARFLIHGYKT